MSVTFFPQGQTYSERCEWDHDPTDHEVYGPCTAPDLPEVNLSNSNAREVLDMLGYSPEDLCGAIPAQELYERCTLAALDPDLYDEGRPTVQTGNVVDCGRRPGYFTDVCHRLIEVCDAAAGGMVCYS